MKVQVRSYTCCERYLSLAELSMAKYMYPQLYLDLASSEYERLHLA
jgi:hypothetical protein